MDFTTPWAAALPGKAADARAAASAKAKRAAVRRFALRVLSIRLNLDRADRDAEPGSIRGRRAPLRAPSEHGALLLSRNIRSVPATQVESVAARLRTASWRGQKAHCEWGGIVV